jgi:hypothetical protein
MPQFCTKTNNFGKNYFSLQLFSRVAIDMTETLNFDWEAQKDHRVLLFSLKLPNIKTNLKFFSYDSF